MYCDTLQGQQDIIPFFIAAWGSSLDVRFTSTALGCRPLSSYLIALDEIVFDGTVFALNNSIEVTLYREDSLWVCESKEYEILAADESPEKAVHSFSEDFAVLWDEIAECPDEDLTKEAQDLKHRLLSIVKSVTKR